MYNLLLNHVFLPKVSTARALTAAGSPVNEMNVRANSQLIAFHVA